MEALASGATLGILGGGQLGRMLALSAANFGLNTHIYDPDTSAPAAAVSAAHTCAAFGDAEALEKFAKSCDVVTFEFENVPEASLLAVDGACPIRPGLKSLVTSQDRLVEKEFIESLGLTVAPFRAVNAASDLDAALEELGGDAILKTRRLGYDGKGQARLSDPSPKVDEAWDTIGGNPAVLEQRIPFAYEISSLIVRGLNGDMVAYDTPINVHTDGILKTSYVGASFGETVPSDLQAQAQQAAKTIADALEHVGVLAVEFFVTDDGALLVNEIAPRVHNSGHWTMDACWVDQFDNHIRAVAGWPLGTPERHSDARMTNLIGEDIHHPERYTKGGSSVVHVYGKAEARTGRKMGHVNRVAPRAY